MIYALASLFQLDQVTSANSTWEAIQGVFTHAEVELTALPHFSWHVASEYDLTGLTKIISELVKGFEPFSINVTGIGIFTGQIPVLYLPVTKTPAVTELHSEMWTQVEPFSMDVNQNYNPHIWIPHITLTNENASDDAICRVITDLAYIPLRMQLTVDHLAVIYRNERTSGIRTAFRFGVGEV